MEENIFLNNSENYDGIVEKISIENNLNRICIVIKQWIGDGTYNLSNLEFQNVLFQCIPDISSFNLITEIIKNNGKSHVQKKLNEYLDDNPTLIIGNTKDNILDEINAKNYVESYFFNSGYCKDWLIICQNMILTENIMN